MAIFMCTFHALHDNCSDMLRDLIGHFSLITHVCVHFLYVLHDNLSDLLWDFNGNFHALRANLYSSFSGDVSQIHGQGKPQ